LQRSRWKVLSGEVGFSGGFEKLKGAFSSFGAIRVTFQTSGCIALQSTLLLSFKNGAAWNIRPAPMNAIAPFRITTRGPLQSSKPGHAQAKPPPESSSIAALLNHYSQGKGTKEEAARES
jgi:hypothetical protein